MGLNNLIQVPKEMNEKWDFDRTVGEFFSVLRREGKREMLLQPMAT